MKRKQSNLTYKVNLYERQLILHAMHKHRGNLINVSKCLGAHRSNMNKYVKKHGLSEELDIVRIL